MKFYFYTFLLALFLNPASKAENNVMLPKFIPGTHCYVRSLPQNTIVGRFEPKPTNNGWGDETDYPKLTTVNVTEGLAIDFRHDDKNNVTNITARLDGTELLSEVIPPLENIYFVVLNKAAISCGQFANKN